MPKKAWQELHKQKTLFFAPFLPNDNKCEDGADSTLVFVDESLQQLLHMKFPRFFSYVVYDKSLSSFLDTFLRYRRRGHDPERFNETAMLRDVSRRVLMLFLRLTGEESANMTADQGVASYGELLYDNWIFDIPKLMDLCTIYGTTNGGLLTLLTTALFQIQPKYYQDLQEAIPLTSQVLVELRRRTQQTSLDSEQLVDMERYLTDIVCTVESLLAVHKRGE